MKPAGYTVTGRDIGLDMDAFFVKICPDHRFILPFLWQVPWTYDKVELAKFKY